MKTHSKLTMRTIFHALIRGVPLLNRKIRKSKVIFLSLISASSALTILAGWTEEATTLIIMTTLRRAIPKRNYKLRHTTKNLEQSWHRKPNFKT